MIYNIKHMDKGSNSKSRREKDSYSASEDSFDASSEIKRRNRGNKKKSKKIVHSVCIIEKNKEGLKKTTIRQLVQNTRIVNSFTLEKKLN